MVVNILVGAIYYSLFAIILLLQLVRSQDIITTFAGTGGGGYNGDSIQATSATLTYPSDVALDLSGMDTT